MNDLPCARWARIADRQAVGEAPTEADERFRLAHEATCPSCGHEAALWRSLAFDETPEEGDPSATPPELLARVLAEVLEDVPPSERRPSRTARATHTQPRAWRRWSAAGAVVAVAAGAWLLVRPAAPPTLVTPSARLLSLQGEVTIDGRPAALGAEIRQGSTLRASGGAACLSIGADVRACIEGGTEMLFHTIDGPARQVGLVSGHVVVAIAHQPAGHGFSVATRAGAVRVVGTVFAVDATDGGPVSARVLEGVVAVTAPGRPEQRVTALQTVALGSTAPEPLAPDEEAREKALLAGTSPPARAVGPTSPPPASEPSPTPPPTPSVEPQAAPSAAAMLLKARELRAGGRFRESAEAYRALTAAHPRSAEARTALVSLGELELGQLGDPAGALRSFELYGAGGGPLSQEAAYGRIRALRALGRTAEEGRSIVAFLAAYPSSAQERALRARLEEIAPDAGP